MGTYVFNGRVLPERAGVGLPPMEVKLEAKEAGVRFDAVIYISNSHLSVMVKTSDQETDLLSLRNYVEDMVRAEVDTWGYLWGRGYDTEIISVVDSSGKQLVFGVGVPELEKARNERPLSLNVLFKVVYKSGSLRRAFGDLREAIRSPLDTGFFCYRAVESTMQHFRKEEDGENRGPAWERMRSELRIDRSWIKQLQDLAVRQRHGQTPYMSAEERVWAMKRAWKVVDRFCVYADRGFIPLPESEFEMLTDP